MFEKARIKAEQHRTRIAALVSLLTFGFVEDVKGQIGIIDVILGFIIVFYALSSTYPTLETAAVSLTNALGNATLAGVSDLSDLPAVAVLLFLLIVIFSIIQDSVRA